jgi:hypothetical protein
VSVLGIDRTSIGKGVECYGALWQGALGQGGGVYANQGYARFRHTARGDQDGTVDTLACRGRALWLSSARDGSVPPDI